MKFDKHLIKQNCTVRQALEQFDILALDAILFLVDDNYTLLGSLTDGDIRRGLLKGFGLEDGIGEFIQSSPKFFRRGKFDLNQMQEWRSKNYKIIPVLDKDNRIVDVVNFRFQKSYLPLDAVIMAGGKGTRLLPLTKDVPKPMLKIGKKPIVEYNVDRLKEYGVRNISFSIKYLGQQLIDYFGNGEERSLNISYIKEEKALGTIGAVALMEEVFNDYLLVMNSDILTNISYEKLFQKLVETDGDMIVATTPYEVQIPYGVIETEGDCIKSLKEKPTYTYYSNAGIYIIKKEHLELIPKNEHFNAPDLMQQLYTSGRKVVHFPILDYWLDIGKPHDFEKAQRDIDRIKF